MFFGHSITTRVVLLLAWPVVLDALLMGRYQYMVAGIVALVFAAFALRSWKRHYRAIMDEINSSPMAAVIAYRKDHAPQLGADPDAMEESEALTTVRAKADQAKFILALLPGLEVIFFILLILNFGLRILFLIAFPETEFFIALNGVELGMVLPLIIKAELFFVLPAWLLLLFWRGRKGRKKLKEQVGVW